MAAISRRHGAEVSLLLGRRGEGEGRYVPRDEDTMFLLANCKSRGRLCRSVSSVLPLPLFALHTHRVDRGCSVRASIMELYC
jgi:hypothetical protein